MDNFQSKYLELIKKQVEEEIDYLKGDGHSDKDNFKPCMFCYENKNRGYDCGRLKELNTFLLSLNLQKERQITHKRREPKFTPQPVDTTHFQLPQLMQPF